MMIQALYYLHITTTRVKFSRRFRFEVINTFFITQLFFCLKQKYTLIYVCYLLSYVIKCLNASFIQQPNITINSFDRYTQVFFETTTCL